MSLIFNVDQLIVGYLNLILSLCDILLGHANSSCNTWEFFEPARGPSSHDTLLHWPIAFDMPTRRYFEPSHPLTESPVCPALQPNPSSIDSGAPIFAVPTHLAHRSRQSIHPCMHPITSPKSRRQTIPHHKLPISLEALHLISPFSPLQREKISKVHTLHSPPTPSSSPGANTLFTYRNTLSAAPTCSFFRTKFTTVSNFWDALILKILVFRRALRCEAEGRG
jgi:hypothetical protein